MLIYKTGEKLERITSGLFFLAVLVLLFTLIESKNYDSETIDSFMFAVLGLVIIGMLIDHNRLMFLLSKK